MWSRRSSTRTRRSSWLATRSATVRPKNPEPTTIKSGWGLLTGVRVVAVRVRRDGNPARTYPATLRHHSRTAVQESQMVNDDTWVIIPVYNEAAVIAQVVA